MYSNTESHYSVIESKNHKGLPGKVSDAVRYLLTYWQSSDGTDDVNAMHRIFMQLVFNWFCCMQMKRMYICWIAGFCARPTTSQDRFIVDWADFQRALRRCHSVNPLYDNLWVCVCVCESVLAVCAVSVVFEQRIHAAKIRGHPWHLTPINQTSAEFYSLSVSLSPSLPPSLPSVLFRWLAVFTWRSSLALGTAGRGISEGKKRWSWEKREKQTVTLVREMGKWSNELAAAYVCVCVCIYAVCVCVSVR